MTLRLLIAVLILWKTPLVMAVGISAALALIALHYFLHRRSTEAEPV
jgi:hypothetical protein